MKRFLVPAITCIILILSACTPKSTDSYTLSEKYSNYFAIGAAISHGHLSDYDTVLLKKHFNSITAENDMKPERTI
ncbi:MAG: endo-1,4-beta-xylanase, partial [Bacteroidales bacterium]